jgi:hypothetical protein
MNPQFQQQQIINKEQDQFFVDYFHPEFQPFQGKNNQMNDIFNSVSYGTPTTSGTIDFMVIMIIGYVLNSNIHLNSVVMFI